MDWRLLVSRFMDVNDRHLSYRRFDRRYYDMGIYLPIYRNEVFRANIGIDVSGSISDKTLAHFFNEVMNIINSRYDDKYVRVFQVDTDIVDEKVYEGNAVALLDIRHGSGGTDFNCLFNKLENENNTAPLIFFTDGDAYIPTTPPSFPVVWVTTGKALPWGENIEYYEE